MSRCRAVFPSILACRRGLDYQVTLTLKSEVRALSLQDQVQLVGYSRRRVIPAGKSSYISLARS